MISWLIQVWKDHKRFRYIARNNRDWRHMDGRGIFTNSDAALKATYTNQGKPSKFAECVDDLMQQDRDRND